LAFSLPGFAPHEVYFGKGFKSKKKEKDTGKYFSGDKWRMLKSPSQQQHKAQPI
jgi:hypothetical protein